MRSHRKIGHSITRAYGLLGAPRRNTVLLIEETRECVSSSCRKVRARSFASMDGRFRYKGAPLPDGSGGACIIGLFEVNVLMRRQTFYEGDAMASMQTRSAVEGDGFKAYEAAPMIRA